MLTKTQTTEYTIPISKFLSLRLYSDTRPRYHHTANLQKGLILSHKGVELVGEGTGFGVPVVRYRDKTYFSGSSTVQILREGNSTTAIKHFALDMVPEKRLGKARIENKLVRKLATQIADLYQRHRHWRLLMLQNLSKGVGVQTSFVQVEPVGKIAITFTVDSPLIHVKADFHSVERSGLQKIFMLNEQGSRYFTKYNDSDGTVLFDKQIGAWEKVEAEWACISNSSEEVGFRLWRVEDTVLRRGREFLKDMLDWVGLDYEVGPNRASFEYDIEVLGSQKKN